MSKPTSYREHSACVNCKHVFRLAEYDSGYEYYCSMGAGPRPPCGSVSMGEIFASNIKIDDPGYDDSYERGMNAWDAWSKDRDVQSHGICDHYEASEEVKK